MKEKKVLEERQKKKRDELIDKNERKISVCQLSYTPCQKNIEGKKVRKAD